MAFLSLDSPRKTHRARQTLAELWTRLTSRHAPRSPEQILAAQARREAARGAVDRLLR